MPSYQCLVRNHTHQTPQKTAIIYEDQHISYFQLDQWISNLQAILNKTSLKKLGIIPIKPIETLIIFFACLREKIDICLLNARYPESENQKIIRYLQADLFIDFQNNNPSWSDFLFEEKKIKTSAIIEKEKAAIFLPTSGSSGKPKIVALSFGNFLHSACSSCKSLDFCSKDSWLLSLPLFHVAGLSIVFRAFFSGGSIEVKHPKVKTEDFFSCQANFVSLVPTQLIRILKKPLKALILAKRLKGLLLGGSLISPSLLKQADFFPIFISYGLTETTSHILLTKPIVFNNHIYLGFGNVHAQIKLENNGEILVRGKALFKGYLQKDQTIQLPLDDQGWFHTKDLGIFSSKLGFSFHARKDLMFISGGENIFPEEIERALLLCEGVDAAFVIPIESQEFGMRPVAFLKTKKNISIIQKSLSTLLPKYKIPVHFYSLPPFLEEAMKIDRRKLKKFVKFENFCL